MVNWRDIAKGAGMFGGGMLLTLGVIWCLRKAGVKAVGLAAPGAPNPAPAAAVIPSGSNIYFSPGPQHHHIYLPPFRREQEEGGGNIYRVGEADNNDDINNIYD